MQLFHLLERYPRITAQRALEEFRNLGFDGQYPSFALRVLAAKCQLPRTLEGQEKMVADMDLRNLNFASDL